MHILLTGGTRGIGKAIKNTFSLSGHTVISPTKQELDLCDIEQVENYVKTLPDIDIIINNAGVNDGIALEGDAIDYNLEEKILSSQMPFVFSQSRSRTVGDSFVYQMKL